MGPVNHVTTAVIGDTGPAQRGDAQGNLPDPALQGNPYTTAQSRSNILLPRNPGHDSHRRSPNDGGRARRRTSTRWRSTGSIESRKKTQIKSDQDLAHAPAKLWVPEPDRTDRRKSTRDETHSGGREETRKTYGNWLESPWNQIQEDQ